jgi:superfamily II DNA or RNA helicase
LFGRVDPALQAELSGRLMTVLSGFAESSVKPLEDWLLGDGAATPAGRSPNVRARLAETLLFRGDLTGVQRLCAGLKGAGVDMVLAALQVARGQWEHGAAAFEAGLKVAAAETGRRKNLASPSMAWIYLMALLAQGTPTAWGKARKFAAAEAGKGYQADPYGLWGPWLSAIDQRLGDAPPSPQHFRLQASERSGLQSLQYLHHLLLAAWLRIEVADPKALLRHASLLAESFDQAALAWLAQLTRRAAASLAALTPEPADAGVAFFVGPAQDRWREALASILALGGAEAGGKRAREAGLQDRLIWIVATDDDARIVSIEAMEQKAGVRGLGKPKPVSLATLARRKDLAAHDAAVLRALKRDDYGNRPLLDLVDAAPALVRHPCVAFDSDPARFVEVSEGLPALEITTQDEHVSFRLLDPVRSEAQRKDEAEDELLPQRWRAQRARQRNVMLIDDGDGRARLVRLTPAQLRVDELVSQGWKVPVSARAEMDAAMRALSAHFQVASDAEAGHEVVADTRLRAELTPLGSGLRLSLRAAPFGEFGPRLPPAHGRQRVTTVHQGLTLSTRRDLGAERAAFERLLQALDFVEDEGCEWTFDAPDQALAVVEALSLLHEHIVSEWPKGRPLRVRAVPAAGVKLRAASKGDWLELDGELELDGGEVLRLRQLLELARDSRSRYVALGEGDFLALGDTLRQQLADLAALAQTHGQGAKQGQRLSNVAALAWEAGGGSLSLDGDAAWRQRSQSWAAAQQQVFDAPAALDAELRDYQLDGYRWLMRLAASGFGAVLADDMGLGKTVQTLALLLQRAAGGPALVVAPTSVCGNWLLEAARFAPGLSIELYGDVGLGEQTEDELAEGDAAPAEDSARRSARRRQVRALQARQVLVCSYALLQIDADILAEVHWHSIVLDEAQAIKNPATRRAKAAFALKGDFKLALTGTPIENRLGELWSIMGFANPGLLGSAEQFARNFGNPIERAEDPMIKAHGTRRLRRLLSPFLKRRTKAEVLSDLPPRTEIVHEVVPGAKERALLEALRQQAEASVGQAMAANAGPGSQGQNQFHVLAALTRLRRAACDPRLVAPELGLIGAKVLEFERLAVELVAGRHKALVFSQFTDFLALLRERLDLAGLSHQYLDGSTPAAERGKRIAAFQAGSGDLFLISLKAGGFGLNLTMADYVIIADPWWNPAAEEQASARAHRIGQQRPVTVYRLVTQGSIEEKIVRLHRSKRDLAEGILSGEDAGAPLDAAQLLELLRAS